MPPFDVLQLDITKTNIAVQQLIEQTQNPRHRHLLLAYDRHRNLEHAGRYEEIFAPDMMVEHPVYRFTTLGQPPLVLDGREQVEQLYRHWAETDQTIFYIEDEIVAVGDRMVASTTTGYHQVRGSDLAASGMPVDEEAMYLTRGRVAMLWLYDERCRLVGENSWELDESERDVMRLEPEHVLTTERAAELLEPYISPLPPFDDSLPPA